ncbi:MAG: hypothetical protein O3B13_23010 [Planctomycetota bacterium]|nr:hypothetical protein [Planctomycetota bacterium]MDA1165978.1 hypothetical protein [Planctomycetota bacterium]
MFENIHPDRKRILSCRIRTVRRFHQNLQSIKGIFERMPPGQLDSIRRHGNATLESSWLAAVTITCWRWTTRETLNDQVKTACSVVRRVWNVETTVSRPGLMNALATSGEDFVEVIVDQLAVTRGCPSSMGGLWSDRMLHCP